MSEFKSQTRFIVCHPTIESYFINRYEFTKNQLILSTLVPMTESINNRIIKANTTKPIIIKLVNSKGEYVDEIKFEDYRLIDWYVSSDWYNDKALEIKLTYELDS